MCYVTCTYYPPSNRRNAANLRTICRIAINARFCRSTVGRNGPRAKCRFAFVMNEAVSRLEYLRFRSEGHSPDHRHMVCARGSVAVVRARINVTGGPLIDDVIIIMHDYVARGMTSTRGRYTARICYVSCAVCNSSTLILNFMNIINLPLP